MSARKDETPPPAPRNNPFAKLRELAKDLPAGPTPESASTSSAPGVANTAGAAPSASKSKPAKTYPGRVTVRREKKGRGGKPVTIAEGPGLSGHPLETYAKELARARGTGARVESASLVVQGEQVERVAAWLGQRGFENVGRGN
ncbi:MAG: translation initiation factor [Planctomycetes bacterium]|nr:translation initiation factor [Planctomycetota bacterium]